MSNNANDIAFALMAEKINASQGIGLWLVDENITASAIVKVNAVPHLTVLTNRSDIAEDLKLAGFKVQLSDFDFSACHKHGFENIFYRISKEKSMVHYIINQVAHYLAMHGLFHISGFKNEGAKNYIDKASKYLGGIEKKVLGGKTSMIASIRADNIIENNRLDDQCYSDFQTITINSKMIATSKPGVFGWNKVDKGSAFLIDKLPMVLKLIAGDISKVADLGCGYGYLSIMASPLIAAKFSAVDNNVAAVNCCRENFEKHAVSGSVELDSFGDNLKPGYDLVLCNPPFHQGFGVEGDLTGRFLRSAARLLNKDGYALFVVNAFIPLEKKAKAIFKVVQLVANNGAFKLLLLKK